MSRDCGYSDWCVHDCVFRLHDVLFLLGPQKPILVTMFRFKLRTLLIATTVIAAFVGLQIHVHNKAARSFEKVGELVGGEGGTFRVMDSSVSPLSLTDVIFFQRRCQATVRSSYFDSNGVVGRALLAEYSYRVSSFSALRRNDVSVNVESGAMVK